MIKNLVRQGKRGANSGRGTELRGKVTSKGPNDGQKPENPGYVLWQNKAENKKGQQGERKNGVLGSGGKKGGPDKTVKGSELDNRARMAAM